MEKQNKSEIILSIVVGFLVLFFIFKAQWLLYTASAVGILGLLSGFFADLIIKFWLKLAEFMGKINGTILLSIIFFVILTPVALLMKLFKKSDELKLKKPLNTTFEDRNYQYQPDDLKNIW